MGKLLQFLCGLAIVFQLAQGQNCPLNQRFDNNLNRCICDDTRVVCEKIKLSLRSNSPIITGVGVIFDFDVSPSTIDITERELPHIMKVDIFSLSSESH